MSVRRDIYTFYPLSSSCQKHKEPCYCGIFVMQHNIEIALLLKALSWNSDLPTVACFPVSLQQLIIIARQTESEKLNESTDAICNVKNLFY